MNEGYKLKPLHVVIADAVAIALGLFLLYELYGFVGEAIISFIVCPIMTIVASVGIYFWANGVGSNGINGPRWSTMNEDQTLYAASVVGIHLAIGMTIISCAIPLVLMGSYGIAAFIVMIILGMGVVMAGVIRVFTGSKVGDRRFVGKSPAMVWGTFLIMLFAIFAVPLLVYDSGFIAHGIEVDVKDNSVEVKAPMVDFDIRYTDISEIKIVDDFDRGSRISGLGGIGMDCGTYKNSSLGKYKLASYTSCDSCIVIETNGGDYYAFNQKSTEDTKAIYDKILAKL